jgi:hypothetical protein
MKKVLLPLILVVLLAVAVIPASAGNGPGSGPGGQPGNPAVIPQPDPKGQGTMTIFRQSSPRGSFAIVGTITAIDPIEKTITLTVLRANYLARTYVNMELTVITTETTKFLYKVTMDTPAIATTFDELAIDDVVSINGISVDDIFTAKRVTEGASLKSLH